ncbi:Cell morphogenesis protein PAG1 [Tulasnella sp. 419]|nr:Cell morphogenesis protein PAG1 [Tulasnella sp. 418]KAG8970726.1 Cell morphogenesis protein PAG1 [Tulasnella sp. 419]
MSNEGFQIEIPSFDDDASNPVIFGGSLNNPKGGFGGFGASTSFGQSESFSKGGSHHARGDSVASDLSNRSFQFGGSHNVSTSATAVTATSSFTPSKSLIGSSGLSSSQVSTTSSPTPPFNFPSRKSSFASIRSAFNRGKSSQQHEPPPVPSIDHGAHPFSRSGSSLAQSPPTSKDHSSRRLISAKSSSQSRPTQASNATRMRSHSYANSISAHSHSSSIAPSEYSDIIVGDGSPSMDSFGVPPVPAVPNEFGANVRRHQNSPIQYSESPRSTVAKPQRPHEYALHIIFTKYITSAERLVEHFVIRPLSTEPLLTDLLASGREGSTDFDSLLESMAQLARKHSNLVIDSIMRWKKTNTNQPIDGSLIEKHMSGNSGKFSRRVEVEAELTRRKNLATIYLLCRSLVRVIRAVPKDGLDEVQVDQLASTFFEEFVNDHEAKRLSASANLRTNAEMGAILLAELAVTRFVSVTDRYISVLSPLAKGQLLKDGGMRYENIVRGVEHLKLTVYPTEAFEEGAEFVEGLSNSFCNAHGQRLKIAFAEVLTRLLHPIGKTAMHEVNHPMWAKAMDNIFFKAKEMMTKPRYWPAAYPLAITSICVAPQDVFLKNWLSCIELSVAKLKEKSQRIVAINGVVRLIWTYLFRSQEPASTTTTKLESILKHFFPPHRRTVNPSDEGVDALVSIIHFILTRHFDFGQNVVMELLHESLLQQLPPTPSLTSFLDSIASDRVIIALRASVLSLIMWENEKHPLWPPDSSFSSSSFTDGNRSEPTTSQDSSSLRPEVAQFFERLSIAISKLAGICGHLVGSMYASDPRYRFQMHHSFEEREEVVVKHHSSELSVAYPQTYVVPIELLRACVETWPRCLHPSVNVTEILDLLIRTILHVDPVLGHAAQQSLRSVGESEAHVELLMTRFTRFLFAPYNPVRDAIPDQGPARHERLVTLWADVLESWAKALENQGAKPSEDRKPLAPALLDDIEAGGLYLLASTVCALRTQGIRALRSVSLLAQSINRSLSNSGSDTPHPLRILHILDELGVQEVGYAGQSFPITDTEHERLQMWREKPSLGVLCSIASSETDIDKSLWRFILPSISRACLEKAPSVFQTCRDTLIAALLRYHPLASAAAEIQVKGPPQVLRSPPPSRNGGTNPKGDRVAEVEQWRTWIMVLCSSALPSDIKVSPVRDTAKGGPDASQRERLSTAKGLFRHLIPFLASDEPRFRSGVIQALGCIHQSAYRTLLEDLQSITRRIYDDSRSQANQKGRRARPADRLHTAVMQVYRLTAHFSRDPKILSDQSTLGLLLQFVRESKTYLRDSDLRLDIDALRLRRFFCGVVENLFQGMASLKDSDRFMSPNTRLTLFRLCQEWCFFGLPPAQSRRYNDMILCALPSGAVPTVKNDDGKEEPAPRKHPEALRLSVAAAGAMCALCSGAFFTTAAMTDSRMSELDEPLEVSATIDWIGALLSDASSTLRQSARTALRSLLTHPNKHVALADEVLRRAFFSTKMAPESKGFFQVSAEVILDHEDHPFDVEHVICLSLSNLSHSDISVRGQAFEVIRTLAESNPGSRMGDLNQMESSVRNPDMAIFLRTQYKVSEFLAEAFKRVANAVIAQCALRLPQTRCKKVYMLKLMEPWVERADLELEDKTLTADGRSTLIDLFALTVHYIDQHPKVIQMLWEKLVLRPLNHHVTSVIKFVLEESIHRGTPEFITYAQRIIAAISLTEVGALVYEELCSIIDSLATGVTPESNATPRESSSLYTANLNIICTSKTKFNLNTGQVALLLLANISIDRPWDFHHQLPTVMHGVLTQVDHPQPFVASQMRALYLHILRSWLPGYDDIMGLAEFPSRSELLSSISNLEVKQSAALWKIVESGPKSLELPKPLVLFCSEAFKLLEPLYPQLRQTWGHLALEWGTTCPVPAIARRSIQIFRAIMPNIGHEMVASMLHRLSNTISDPNKQFQAFAREIMLTLRMLTRSHGLDSGLLPSLFWSSTACLSTVVETEFSLTLDIFSNLIEKIDFTDEAIVRSLEASKPSEWQGDGLSLHHLVMFGLRSSGTSSASFELLTKLAKLPHTVAIDPSDARLRCLFTVALPWCLQALEEKIMDPVIAEFAIDIASIADSSQRSGISRIMISVAKNRFRTKDDFLRQAVGCLREYFMASHSTEIVTILLGLVLNDQSWLRLKTMQILKLLFGHAETRNPLILHGTDLLMPLLRLLTTEFAQQALEVLDEPLAVSGGPTATQVLRMSMHRPNIEGGDLGDIFGFPNESGWCIAKPHEMTETCRHNIFAVCTSFHISASMPASMILFTNEDGEVNDDGMENGIGRMDPSRTVFSDVGSVGDLVNTLHDLGEFFQNERQQPSSNVEERVAMILNRSFARAEESNGSQDRSASEDEREFQEVTFTVPPTPGPHVDLFALPRTSMDLQRNFEVDSDHSDSGDEFATHPKRYDSPQSLDDSEDGSEDEERMDAFSLEEGANGQAMTRNRLNFKRMIGTHKVSRNLYPPKRRV